MTYNADPGKNSPALHHFYFTHSLSEENGRTRSELHFQDGPIREYGVNGVTNEEVIQALVDRLNSLQEMNDRKYACKENAVAITHLETALAWLNLRTKRREDRGVEGTNQP